MKKEELKNLSKEELKKKEKDNKVLIECVTNSLPFAFSH